MAYNPFLISDIIISESNRISVPADNTRLQRLLYFIQAKSFYLEGIPVVDAEFYAWRYGPVIPEIYSRFKHYGSSELPLREVDYTSINKEDLEIIRETIQELKDFGTFELVDIVQRQDPWGKTYNPYITRKIKNEDMKKYFYREGQV